MAEDMLPGSAEPDGFDEQMRRRASQVQDAVIRRAMKQLTEADKAAGRVLPRDVLTYVRYVNERFLAAFAEAAGERRYALKGGNAIAVMRANADRFPSRFESPRETRDIDMRIEKPMSEGEVRELFDQIVTASGFRLLSGLTFGEPKVTAEVAQDGFLPGMKIECNVFLGPGAEKGKGGVPFKLEMTFGALAEGSWTVSPYPTLASMGPARTAWGEQKPFVVSHVVPEMMFADKLHAVARYGDGNTRLKDVFDLHCLCTQYDLDGDKVRGFLLKVFEEFGEQHLLVGSAAQLPGLDAARFPNRERDASWQSDWRNWTGCQFGKDTANSVPSVGLADALRSVAGAVDALGVFNAETAAIGEEARLARAPVQQVLGFLRGAARITPEDVEALRSEALGRDVGQSLWEIAFEPRPGRPAAAVRLARAHAAARSVGARAASLVALHHDLLSPEEHMALTGLGAVCDAMAASVEAVLADPSAPAARASSNVAAAAAAMPDRLHQAHPLRQVIAARAPVHARVLADVRDAYRRAAEILRSTPEVSEFKVAAEAARLELRLQECAAHVSETRALARTAEAFADPDGKARLQAAGNALDALAKALGTADRALVRATAVTVDARHNVFGKDLTREAVAEKAKARLADEVASLAGAVDRALAALAPLAPRAGSPDAGPAGPAPR